MSYKQVKSFSLARMGTRQGWCLQNVRLGFGIASGHYESALKDMQAQRANGTLHSISTIPKNCAVPVYCDTPSRFEHVIAYDHGKVYSDGKLSSLSNFHIFGWGEFCDGQRVVQWVADKPKSYTFRQEYCDGFLPYQGSWGAGDKHANVNTIAKWLRRTYPAYTKQEALGDFYGVNLTAAVKEFQRRTKGAGNYGGEIDGTVGPKTYATMRLYGFTHAGIKPVENPEPKPAPKPTPEPEKPAEKPQKPAEQPEETKPQEQPKPAEKPAKQPENGQNGQNKPAEQDELAKAQETIKKLTETIELIQSTQKKHGLPSLEMPSQLYDFLKFTATTALPALNALYIGLANIWGFGFGAEIDSTIQLIVAFINAILGAVVIKAGADHRKANAEK